MTKLMQFKEPFDISGYTLLIPSVAVGNVPQLTIDLLITTHKLKKIATIWHPAIISSVGGDPYGSDDDEICTACELYANQNCKLAAIQFRSSLEVKLATHFFKALKESLESLNVKQILILSSAFDYELHVITSDKFYYISNENVKEEMEHNKIKPVEKDFNGRYSINGSGYAVKLFELLGESMGCTILVKYVSEGDNIPDAVLMNSVVVNLLKLKTDNLQKLTLPSSWKYVFGGPPPVGIY